MNYWPLYFILVHGIAPILSNEIVLAGLVVSTVAAFIAAIFLWKYVVLVFLNERLANLTVLAWAIFPTSIFLVAPFTDSLFACWAILTLYFLHKNNWITSGIFCILAGLTRSQGILLVVPFIFYIGIEIFKSKHKFNWKMVLGLVLAPLGTVSLFIWRWSLELPDIFNSYSIYSNARIVDPFSAVILAFQRFFLAPDLLMGTEILSVLIFTGTLIWMLTNPVFRKEVPLLSYGIVMILFNLIKHNLTATPIQSSNRYVLNILPAFIGFGYFLLSIQAKTRQVIILLSISIGLIVGALYALWIFIG